MKAQSETAMKTIQLVLVIILAIATSSPAWADESEAIKKDMARLQGEWSIVSGSADGEPVPESMLKQMKRVCKGDETTTTMAGQIFMKAKITIDPSKQPKTIDYQMTEGFTQGQKQLGIYEVNGDTFKACFGKPGAAPGSESGALGIPTSGVGGTNERSMCANCNRWLYIVMIFEA